MVKLINKYDAIRICDRCGDKSIIQRCTFDKIKKNKYHFCHSCANKDSYIPHAIVGCTSKLFFSKNTGKELNIKNRARLYNEPELDDKNILTD